MNRPLGMSCDPLFHELLPGRIDHFRAERRHAPRLVLHHQSLINGAVRKIPGLNAFFGRRMAVQPLDVDIVQVHVDRRRGHWTR